MSITGLVVTDDNGVMRITDTQTGVGATIDGECIILDSSTSRLKSTVLITDSVIRIDSDVTSGGGDTAVLTYGKSWDSSKKLIVKDSLIHIAQMSSRKNVLLSSVINSKVLESQRTQEVFVYTQRDAVVENSIFDGIATWEIAGKPLILFNVLVKNTRDAYLNWAAGRLDFVGFKVENIENSHSWLGNHVDNHNYHWDNHSSFDNTRISFYVDLGQYTEGFTHSFKFLEQSTLLPLGDVKVAYSSDESGSMVQLGEYLSKADGTLAGTYDSQFETTVALQDFPTIFVRTNKTDTSLSDYIQSNGLNASFSYGLVLIQSKIEIKSYNHLKLTEYSNGIINPDSPKGSLNPDFSVNTFEEIYLVVDHFLTELDINNLSSVVSIDDVNTFYDFSKKCWHDLIDYPVFTKDGQKMDLGTTGLVIDATAIDVYLYNISTDMLTIKSAVFSGDIKTTGNITVVNGAIINGTTQDSVANSQLTISVPAGFDNEITVYLSSADAESKTSSKNSGNVWKYHTDLFSGVTVWFRLESNVSGVHIIQDYTIPTEIGIYNASLVIPTDTESLTFIRSVSDKLNQMIEDVSGLRFKTKALEQASGSGGAAYDDTILIGKVDAIQAELDIPDQYKSDNSAIIASIAVLSASVADKTGYSLTSVDKTAIANEVEQAILNEGDGTQVLNAIVGAIGNQNIDQTVLVAAIRADIERVGGISQLIKSTVDGLDNYDDTVLVDKLTNVLSNLAALENISINDVQTAFTNQGFTEAKALLLDASISSRATPSQVWLETVRTITQGSIGLPLGIEQKILEIYQRLDLDKPNTYADDSTSIINTDFTLTRTDQGNGTSVVTKT